MKIGEWKQQEYKEIDSLEAYLLQYQNEWNDTKEIRSNKWRKYFFVCFDPCFHCCGKMQKQYVK